MKRQPVLIFAMLVTILFSGFQNADPFQPIAVVELFTSEGCSSCPPADQLLSSTTADAVLNRKKIFTLSFHVDYWDRLGWKDPFGDKLYTDRQSIYSALDRTDGAYTPQMVVNGASAFVGSKKTALDEALKQAQSIPAKAAFQFLYVMWHNNDKGITVHYELTGNYKDCEVHFALVFEKASTGVKKGENAGMLLQHSNVVRQFVTVKANAKGEANFSPSPQTDRKNMDIIAYVQRNSDHVIIGAAHVKP